MSETRTVEKPWELSTPDKTEITEAAPFLCNAKIEAGPCDYDLRWLVNGRGGTILKSGKSVGDIDLEKGETLTVRPAKSDLTGDAAGMFIFVELPG
ncbi:MAG: hypothetical protein QNK37_04960 [Acidobacteriota bacterium]|nr:hypothetical protein [Acidobacteriota bacterium]